MENNKQENIAIQKGNYIKIQKWN